MLQPYRIVGEVSGFLSGEYVDPTLTEGCSQRHVDVLIEVETDLHRSGDAGRILLGSRQGRHRSLLADRSRRRGCETMPSTCVTWGCTTCTAIRAPYQEGLTRFHFTLFFSLDTSQ